MLKVAKRRPKKRWFGGNTPSVADGNLITAGCTGALLWTRQFLARLDVLRPDTPDARYNDSLTGKAEHFFALMQSLPGGWG